jgi:2-phosphoglycolate phosphatase
MKSRLQTLASPPECVLFDLDGTLVDTAPDFAHVLNRMSKRLGISPPNYQQVHQNVSNGARALLDLTFSINEEHPNYQEYLATLLTMYAQQIETTRSRLYPGMNTLLEQLEHRSIPWGVVTNKPERFSTALMDKLGLINRCATLVCPEHVTKSKPDPEPLLLACTQLDSTPSFSVYIGDHPRDIIAGINAGMFTIAATYGYLPTHPPVLEWGADLIVKDVDAIMHWLLTTDRITN